MKRVEVHRKKGGNMMRTCLKPEDFYRFESIAEPQLSPNKQEILYMKRKVETGKTKFKSALYITNYNNPDNVKQLTEFSQNAKDARWSPCGSYISYVISEKEETKLCVYNIHTKQIAKLDFEGRISSVPVWSYNSKQLAVTAIEDKLSESEVAYDGAPSTDTNSKTKTTDVRVITDIDNKFDGLGFYGSAKNEAYIVTLQEPFNVSSLSIERVTSGDGNYSYPVFNLHSDGLYAVKQHKDKSNLFNEYTLVEIEIESKMQKEIITTKGLISHLQLSPKGNEIAFIALGSDEMYYDSRLYIYSFDKVLKSFEDLEDVTINLSRNIGEQPFSDVRYHSNTTKFKWLKNCNGFTILYVDHGASVIAEIYRDLSPKKILWFDDNYSISAFSRIKNNIIVLLGCSNETENVYDLRNNNLVPLIKVNEWLSTERILGNTTRFNYLGAEGEKIDGWYITPSNYNQTKKLPTILMIHGGPQGIYGSSFMFWTQIFVANGYAVLYTNPRGSLSYGIDFALKVIDDWGNKDYIDIIKGLEYLIDLGIADSDKLGVTGWSYGGYMTSWIITKSNMFKAAVACASVTNLYSMYGTCDKGYNFLERQLNANPWDNGIRLIQHSPLNYIKKVNTPVLLIHGENDLRCPISQSEELFTALKRLNKKAVLVRYDDEYHGFTNPSHIVDFLIRSLAWMNYYILKK